MLVGEEYEVTWYRVVTSTWAPPTRTPMGSFMATIQPFTADDGLYNNQTTENVRYLLVTEDADLILLSGDQLEFWDTVVQKVSNSQRNKSGIIPHLDIFTSDLQV